MSDIKDAMCAIVTGKCGRAGKMTYRDVRHHCGCFDRPPLGLLGYIHQAAGVPAFRAEVPAVAASSLHVK
jgi:hypothetical protein